MPSIRIHCVVVRQRWKDNLVAVFQHHTVEVYGGVEVKFRAFVTSALGGLEL